MNKNGYIIRSEKEDEHFTVEALVRQSFWNVYRPGCNEHYLLHVLRSHPDFINGLNFVMETDGRIIGQIVFVKAEITADDGRTIPILTMGPVCIANDLKRMGYGKILLEYGFEKAAEYGAGAVCFEGNIGFYGKSGCVMASEYGIRYYGMPDGEDADFFLCKELKKGYLNGVSGVYKTPQAYEICEEEAEEYDKQFPPMKKLRLPGQIF